MRLAFVILSVSAPTFVWETYFVYGEILIGFALLQEVVAYSGQKTLHGPEPVLSVLFFPLPFSQSGGVSVSKTIHHRVELPMTHDWLDKFVAQHRIILPRHASLGIFHHSEVESQTQKSPKIICSPVCGASFLVSPVFKYIHHLKKRSDYSCVPKQLQKR